LVVVAALGTALIAVGTISNTATAENARHGIVLIVVRAALAKAEHELGVVLEGDGHVPSLMVHTVDAVQVHTHAHAHAEVKVVRGTSQRHAVRAEGEVGFERLGRLEARDEARQRRKIIVVCSDGEVGVEIRRRSDRSSDGGGLGVGLGTLG